MPRLDEETHTKRGSAAAVSIITVCQEHYALAVLLLPVSVLVHSMMVMLHLQPGTAALGCLYMLPQGCLQRGLPPSQHPHGS